MSRKPQRIDPIDLPLLRLSQEDSFTLRHACEGTIIFGQTGSGKTSGPGQALRSAMLRAG